MRLDARAWVSCCDMHFLRLLQGSQCWRHKEQRKSEGALARRCVVGCALGKGRVRVCYVLGVYTFSFRRNRQWGAAPFTLDIPSAGAHPRVPPF